jgi:hypothetical protein
VTAGRGLPAHTVPVINKSRPSSQGGAPMLARVSRGTTFVFLTWCLVVAGTRTATAQLLCPKVDVDRPFREASLVLDAGFPRAPETITVDADLRAFGSTLPGGTWRMPSSGGLASDGLALEGVSFRNTKSELGSMSHAFEVVVDLRAWDSRVTDLELVVVDGERRLRVGAIPGIVIHCEAKSVARTFSITDRDFVSFFAGGRTPTLRVERTTRADGC